MIGYWNRPQATAETLRDGWLYSGDVATMDADGYITICDRIKDMIISGGENIYPAEIEIVILSHNKVLEVAVIGQKNKQWGEIPLAVVVAKAETNAQQLLDYCDGKLARFKIPGQRYFRTNLSNLNTVSAMGKEVGATHLWLTVAQPGIGGQSNQHQICAEHCGCGSSRCYDGGV